MVVRILDHVANCSSYADGDTIFVDIENERLAFKRLPADLVTAK